ncbi:MAG: potassium transporter Kup [Bdellovibrionota bacterium]
MTSTGTTPPAIAGEHSHHSHEDKGRKYLLLAVLGALGVVYGDIGTSPLYAIRECFHGMHAVPLTTENLIGIVSLIFWALIVEVSLKYILFVMRADNRGEGGVLALMALAAHPQRPMQKSDKRRYLLLIGLFGAALLYGDGIITPAISVLSAVEGLDVATPFFRPYIIPITVVILCGLFYFQKSGTAKMGRVFGPIILVWFSSIGLLGLFQILRTPSVMAALFPWHAISFFIRNGGHGFVVLGSVFLAVTGGEALYADMGHFGRKPIRLGWFYVALPALVLNYFGQAAMLIREPEAIENPFYHLAPNWLLYPLVILATAATVIASQALISGAFSLTRQAVQLGCFPRLNIRHTSSDEIGQIYVPLVNRGLLIMTIVLVIGFRSSSNMAAAYGIAVSTTMVITTILTYFVSRDLWAWSFPKAALISGSFLLVDLVFFFGNAIKIEDGGWVPLAIGAFIFTLMTTWRSGRQILARRLRSQTAPFERFRETIHDNPPIRVPGTAIFMTGNIDGTPPALVHNLRHNKMLHMTVVLLMVRAEEAPYVDDNERVTVTKLEDNFYQVSVRCGFMETPDVPAVLAEKERYGITFDTSSITYFLGRETVLATEAEGMAIWREKLFAFMTRNAERATSFYRIPSDQVIEIGLQIEI